MGCSATITGGVWDNYEAPRGSLVQTDTRWKQGTLEVQRNHVPSTLSSNSLYSMSPLKGGGDGRHSILNFNILALLSGRLGLRGGPRMLENPLRLPFSSPSLSFFILC